MNILVTGATGRLGSRLVPRLLDRGDTVRLLVRQPEQAQALEDLGAELVKGDLLQPDTCTDAVAGVDAIIHLAAFFRGATPAETQAVNLEGTLALARAALVAGAPRFVFASTNLVYGPGQRDKLFQEDDPCRPEAPYPTTKAAAEAALLELHRTSGLDLRILRFAFVYGESDPHLTEGLQWFRSWNPLQPMHLVHHADAAQAIMLATDAQGIGGQIYNVADDEPVTAGDLLQLYKEPIAVEAANRPLNDAWLQLVETGKIREQLGYRPLYPTLRHAINKGAL